jgi:hypothetical protein
MGHPQPQTPIQTNNSMAEGVNNHKIKLKRTKAMDMCSHWLRDRKAQGQFWIYWQQTKAMDMRFHWLHDCKAQGQFWIYWQPGKLNSADYFTRHHSPLHRVNVRYEFLSKVKELAEARSQRLTQEQTPQKLATSRLATRAC